MVVCKRHLYKSRYKGFVPVGSRLSGIVGRKSKIIDLEIVKRVPLKKRRNILSHTLSVPTATLHKDIKSGFNVIQKISLFVDV